MTSGDASTIRFGDGLDVTDEGAATIRVDTPAGRTDLLQTVLIEELWNPFIPDPPQFDLQDIPGDYSDLIIVLSLRSTEGLHDITFNDDHDNYYSARPYDSRVPGSTIHYDTATDTDSKIRLHPAGTAATASQYSHYTILIPGYASSSWVKTFQIQGVAVSTEPEGLLLVYDLLGGVWHNTDPVDRFSLARNDYQVGSQLRLYGRQ